MKNSSILLLVILAQLQAGDNIEIAASEKSNHSALTEEPLKVRVDENVPYIEDDSSEKDGIFIDKIPKNTLIILSKEESDGLEQKIDYVGEIKGNEGSSDSDAPEESSLEYDASNPNTTKDNLDIYIKDNRIDIDLKPTAHIDSTLTDCSSEILNFHNLSYVEIEQLKTKRMARIKENEERRALLLAENHSLERNDLYYDENSARLKIHKEAVNKFCGFFAIYDKFGENNKRKEVSEYEIKEWNLILEDAQHSFNISELVRGEIIKRSSINVDLQGFFELHKHIRYLSKSLLKFESDMRNVKTSEMLIGIREAGTSEIMSKQTDDWKSLETKMQNAYLPAMLMDMNSQLIDMQSKSKKKDEIIVDLRDNLRSVGKALLNRIDESMEHGTDVQKTLLRINELDYKFFSNGDLGEYFSKFTASCYDIFGKITPKIGKDKAKEMHELFKIENIYSVPYKDKYIGYMKQMYVNEEFNIPLIKLDLLSSIISNDDSGRLEGHPQPYYKINKALDVMIEKTPPSHGVAILKEKLKLLREFAEENDCTSYDVSVHDLVLHFYKNEVKDESDINDLVKNCKFRDKEGNFISYVEKVKKEKK